MDLDARFAQDLRGHTATTERLGAKLAIVAKKEVAGLEEARRMRTSTETQEESSSPAISICNSRAGREFESPRYPYSLGVARYGPKSLSPPRTAAMKQTPLCSVTAPVQPS